MLGQRIDSLWFKIHLPHGNLCAALRCKLPRPLQRLTGEIATDNLHALPGQKNGIVPFTTGQIQDRAW